MTAISPVADALRHFLSRRYWLVNALVVALLVVGNPVRAGAQIAPIESDREIAAYLRQVWRLKRARRPPPPTLPPLPWSCKIAPRISIDTSGAKEGPAVIRGFVYRADSVAAVAATQGLASTVRVEQTTIAVTGANDGTFEFAVPAVAIGAGRRIAVIIGANGHANTRAELRVVAGARVHIDAPLCMNTAIIRERWTSDHSEWGGFGHRNGPKTLTINAPADGVEEAGTVKRIDEFLVVLRRGRLFSIDTRHRTLRPVAAIDAFAPSIRPEHTWFDELVVYSDRVIVVGFDYNTSTTMIGAFRLDERGGLRHERTYTLTGAAHNSSRSFVSRLIDSKFVLYAHADVPLDSTSAANSLPVLREWRARESSRGAGSVNHAQRVYRPVGAAATTPVDAMHTVTTCDLARANFACESTTVLATDARAHYVSATAVYISTSALSWSGDRSVAHFVPPMLVRVPLDGQAATALRVDGTALDQRSFVERTKTLYMVLRAVGPTVRAWERGERGGTLGLLSLPIEQLRVGLDPTPSQYRSLPTVRGSSRVENRFVGDALVYGGIATRAFIGTNAAVLHIASLREHVVRTVSLDHDVERIEAIGDDALVIGRDSAANLHWSGVRLRQTPARVQHDIIGDRDHVYARSRPLTYRPDESRTRSGVIALSITRADRTGRAFQNQVDAVHYLRNTGNAFKPLGELASQPMSPYDDCQSSCADWYGEARPIFFDGRIFALLGYEIVEGAIVRSRIVETRRLNFLPTTKPR